MKPPPEIAGVLLILVNERQIKGQELFNTGGILANSAFHQLLAEKIYEKLTPYLQFAGSRYFANEAGMDEKIPLDSLRTEIQNSAKND